VNNITFKRLAYTLTNWGTVAFRWLKSRQNIVLTVGISALTGLSLPLLYQLAVERHNDPTRPNQLIAAYQDNGYMALACFGALAAGYIYWMLQMLAGETSESEDKGLARWSDRMFLLVLGSIIATLGLWNLGMLVR
jgi:cyanate permease